MPVVLLLAIAVSAAVALGYQARQRARAGLIEPEVDLVPDDTVENGVAWLLVGGGAMILALTVVLALS